MASNSRKRQTFAKLTRERAVQEKRAKKREAKEEKRLAAAAETEPTVEDPNAPPEIDEAEVRRLSRLR
jgi:hypothetical protein